MADNHHAHLIIPLEVWERLGKLVARRKAKGEKTNHTQLFIEGAELLLKKEEKR